MANAEYQRERRRQARISGDWSDRVPACRAQLHIRRLMGMGIGRKAISDASGVSENKIRKIRDGGSQYISMGIEKAILAVDKSCIADSALVPAARTWQLIGRLLDCGFSRAELARRLGLKACKLRLQKDFILAQTAVRVEKLYNQISRENGQPGERCPFAIRRIDDGIPADD
jgi:hypothetical protein